MPPEACVTTVVFPTCRCRPSRLAASMRSFGVVKSMNKGEPKVNDANFQFDNKPEIQAWLESKNVEVFRIRDDLTVDVHGDVRLQQECFARLPVAFGTVTGDFEISDSALASLYGSPTEVWGDFVCRNCRLKSFSGTPHRVGGDLDVSGNQIESFAEAPEYWWIKGRLSVGSNAFTTLAKIREHLKSSRIGRLDFGENGKISANIVGLMWLSETSVFTSTPTYAKDDSDFARAMAILEVHWGDCLGGQSALLDADMVDFAKP